jgi:prepilin-type processing-associated H-X9-DG protein
MITPYQPTGYNQAWNSRWQKNLFLCPGYDYDPGSSANSAHIYKQSYISSWRIMQYNINAFFGYGNLSTQTQLWWPKRYATNPKPTQVLMGEIYSASPQLGYNGFAGNRINPHNGGTNTLLVGGSVITLMPGVWSLNNAANGFFYY